MKTGRPRELSPHPCAEPGCTAFVTVNDWKHYLRRCRACRVARPLERRIAPKPERKRTTDASVWEHADRVGFTEVMAKHFAALRPGLSLYSDRTEPGGKRLGKKTANRSAI